MRLLRSVQRQYFWIHSILTILFWTAVSAVCLYGFVDVWQYMQHTTPCQRMGTC